MPHKCKKCLRELHPWSKFKDLKSKEGLGLAICHLVGPCKAGAVCVH